MKFLNIIVFISLVTGWLNRANAQGYQVKDGLKYKIFTSHNGRKPVVGDIALVDMTFFGDGDKPVFSSLDKGQAVTIPVAKPQFKGDLMQGIMMLGIGDSAVFLVNGDSVSKITGQNSLVKPGSELKYVIKLLSIFDPREQLRDDIDTIQAYLKKNHIKGAKQTEDGIFYTIAKKGSGPLPKDSQTITAHYTGKFLDGKTFDDDKGKGLPFVLGRHEVIPGWEKGFALLRKGAKATLYIPSGMGYSITGGGVIPPNTILVFEVEVVDLK